MPRINLNEIAPKSPAGFDFTEQDRGVTSGDITVYFGDVTSAVEKFILESDALVGCVAWVRGPRFVEALGSRPVALVVNKEFSLRIEGHHERAPLTKLQGGVPSKLIPAPVPQNGPLEAARCAGWAVRGKFGALMHHKFLVRFTKAGNTLKPTAVWTGSFNLTTGAASNIENGMAITDPKVVKAFLDEFARVWAVSEPLLFAAGTPTPGGGNGGQLRTPAPKRKRAPAKRKPAPKRKPAAKPAPKRKPAAKRKP